MVADINKELKEIYHLIDENQIISFDIYDTALLRNVLYPTDIFDLVQIEINKSGDPFSDFKNMRIMAEQKARSRSLREDIHFEEIYSVIGEWIGKEKASRIKLIELQMESLFTITNPFIKRAYDYALNKGKVIYFISDMYLDHGFIEKLLRDNGYGTYNGLYISGMIGTSKASAKLYDYIRRHTQAFGDWLHIGDNYVSDHENARINGLNTYYYRAVRDRVTLPKEYSLEYSIIKAIQINKSETTIDLSYWERFGINVVSSLFLGFTIWLAEKLQGKDNVYFISRDGYLPLKIYNKITKKINGLPRAEYLYASRKMYQLPTIVDMEQNEALNLLVYSNTNLGQTKSLLEIFNDLGLFVEDHLTLLKKYEFTPESRLFTDADKSKMKELLSELFPRIKVNMKKCKQLVAEYLEQQGIYNQNEINIVDIGWRGSTQRAIKNITNIKTKGYYFGTSYNVYDDIRSEVRSFCFHLGRPIHLMQKVMDHVMMYEFIFTAPHGFLTGFKKNEGKIIPILSNESNQQLKIIEEIQTSILNIVDDYLDYWDYIKEVDIKDSLRDYMEFIDSKKYEDLLHFEELSVSVGFGEKSESLRFVTRVSIKDYLKNRNEIEKMATKNLWKSAIIVEGSAEEFRSYKKTRPKPRAKLDLITINRVKKALRNPKKALKYLINMMVRK